VSLPAALRHGSLVLALSEKRVTIQTQLSGLAPTFRHRAVESADYPRHFFFSRETFPNGITPSPLVSATLMIQAGQESSGTRVAITSRYEWREVKLLIADGGIDGYGAGGYSTAIE
jgi:hypothetical protein